MSVEEQDDRPKFDFGATEKEVEEITDWVKGFKDLPQSLPAKYLHMLQIPKREESTSRYVFVLPPSPNHANPSSRPSLSIPNMDLIMEEVASSSPSNKFHFGVDSINKLISQMHEQHVLNIACQKRAKIRDAILLLGNWVTYKKTQDSTITPQHIKIQLVVGFSGFSHEWWIWFPQETRNDMLATTYADEKILSIIGRHFYSPDDEEDYDHLPYLFMSQRLCDLEKHEQYFCYMQNLLITSGNAKKPKFLKCYLRSFPSHILDAVENFLKEKKRNLKFLSLSQLHAHIIQVWEEHCLEKRVSKYFKRHSSMFFLDFSK
jgi:hypothetical protein